MKKDTKITVPASAKRAGLDYYSDVVRGVLGPYSEQSPVTKPEFDLVAALVFGSAVQLVNKKCGLNTLIECPGNVALAHDIDREEIIEWLQPDEWACMKQILLNAMNFPNWTADRPLVRFLNLTLAEVSKEETTSQSR